ncbi:helix-turn-helix domain-containing protein [Neiella marina]|nr:helix-turn-helix transcriptional regulator [Neiella marina]
MTTVLKQLFKEKGLTYRQIAARLDMSEANVKRIFATQSFTLERLESMCHLLNLSLADLFALTDKNRQRISQLTEQQELELVSDTKLFLVAVCVRDHWRFEEITATYQIETLECVRLMARLDRLKMIQLLPNNDYKLLVAQDFRWRANGPLEQFISREVIHQFLASRFSEPECFRFYFRGSFSSSSINLLQRKLQQLTKEAAWLKEEDAKLPLTERQPMGLLMAMRPWELSSFKQLRRHSKPSDL